MLRTTPTRITEDYAEEFSTLLYNSFSEISVTSSFIQTKTENLSAGMKFLVLSPFKFGGMGLPNYRLLSHFVYVCSVMNSIIDNDYLANE